MLKYFHFINRYSGITSEILASENTTLGDVQQRLLEIISHNDIIVGHSLDNDMRALKVSPYIYSRACFFADICSSIFDITFNHSLFWY